MDTVISGICDCVSALQKENSLSYLHQTWYTHTVYFMAVSWHVLTRRSHSDEKCHSCMVASEVYCCDGCCATAANVGLHIV